MSPKAHPRKQDDANQSEQTPQSPEQSAQSANAARAYQEISAPAVIDDNSAQQAERDYYDDDDDSDLIEIVRYRQEHPAPTIRVTLDEMLTL